MEVLLEIRGTNLKMKINRIIFNTLWLRHLRQIEERKGITRSTGTSILKRHKFNPYRERPRQLLQNNETIRRMAFCQWFIQKNN